MRSYDTLDSYEFMNSNAHYRVLAYMVQPFFENGEGETLPDTPTMKFIPLENDSSTNHPKIITHGDMIIIRQGIRIGRMRRYREKLIKGIKEYEERNIKHKEAP